MANLAAIFASAAATRPVNEATLELPTLLDTEHNLEIRARIDAGANPREDAASAASKHAFGLIAVGQDVSIPRPAGVICNTPQGRAPDRWGWFIHSDYVDEEVTRVLRYAIAYNRAMVAHPIYPRRNICRSN